MVLIQSWRLYDSSLWHVLFCRMIQQLQSTILQKSHPIIVPLHSHSSLDPPLSLSFLLRQVGLSVSAQIPNRVQPLAPTNSIDWRRVGTTHSWNVIPRISSLSTSSILRFSLGVIICHNPSSWGLLVDKGNWCHLVHLLQTSLMDVLVVPCCYAWSRWNAWC